MLKRVCAIALTVAMLLSMVCTFSVASAADAMALRVVFENGGLAGRGETVKAEIWVDNYTECSAMGVSGTYDTTVFDAAAFDVAGIVLETTAFNLGERSAINNGEFYFSVLSADAQLENVVMSETSFKLATVALKLKTDYFTTPGKLEVKFYADNHHMCWTDATKIPIVTIPKDAVVALDSNSYTTAPAEATVSLKPITDKMEIVLKDAPATVVRGQEFTVTVAAKNYKALASYGFDVNYDNTVLEVVDTQIVLGDNLVPEEDSITGDTDHVRVVEVSNANMGQDAAEQDLAKVTFRVCKDAALNKDAGLNAKFVIKEGSDANTLAYYVAGNVDPIEMVKDYEYVATPAVANTKVVANANMMSLEITTNATTVDRGDEVVLDINLKNAVPFAGMDVYIPVDDTVFALESSSAMANIVEKGGKKVVYLMIANGANVSGVTDLATVTLKVKDTAAFGKTKLENAIIAMAAEFVSDPEPSKPLVLDADYENPANLIEINVVCDHAPEGFKLVNNYNGTHDIECNVPDCPYLVDDVACTPASSVETPATCTAAGYYTKTCACGYVWVEASGEAALNHDLKTVHIGGTSTDSKHTTTCSRGDYTATEPCTFNEVVVRPATCLKEGETVATCSACGFSYTKYPAPLAHTKTKTRYYCPTGDTAGKWSYYCDICQDWPAANDVAIPAGHPFPDVTKSTSWFYKGVQYAKMIGVFSGDSNGKFNANSNITRAEVATVLVRYLGYEAQYKDLKTATEFETYLANLYAQTGVAKKELSDLKADSWYYRAASVACALGIFKGDDKNCFNPNNNISRQEFCLVLYRLYKDAGLKIDTAKTYADIAKVPNWSKEAVLWAGSVGLFNGDQYGNFNATQNATRAQVALLMMRIDADLRDIEIM